MNMSKGRLAASQAMCDALAEEEQHLPLHGDAQTFQLHVQFVRAHGMPQGDLTTLAIGGVLSSGAGAQ